MIARVKSRQVYDGQVERACEAITRRVKADVQALKKRSIGAALRERATPPFGNDFSLILSLCKASSFPYDGCNR